MLSRLEMDRNRKAGLPRGYDTPALFREDLQRRIKALEVEIEERFKATAEVELNLFAKHRKLRRSRDH
jgi:hypothetical protein